jgi:monoamine oxidase
MKVVVIGAGLAGLAAADELHGAGVDVEVFEASERVGGRVWSVPFADLGMIERGAEFVLPGADALVGLANRFGLQLRRKGMRYAARELRGGAPTSVAELAAAVERIKKDSTSYSSVEAAFEAHRVPPAIAEALRSRLATSNGNTTDDLSLDELTLAGSEIDDYETHTVIGGNMRFAECLAGSLERPVKLGVPVRRIAHTSGGVVIGTSDGEVSADAVVVAVPARVMRDIVFEPSLPAAKETKTLKYSHAAKLFVHLHEPVAPSATQSVPGRFWCWTELDVDGQPRSVLGALAGTEEALAALEIDSGPERWLDAIERLRPDLRLDRKTVMLSTWRDQPWIRAVQVARSLTHPMIDEALARPVGRLSFAGEHTAGATWHGSMEGAVRSGRRAAAEALAAARHGPGPA